MGENEKAQAPAVVAPPHPRIYYYPGCSLLSTAKELGESVFQMSRLVGSWLEELRDWNCCGSSPAHSVNQNYAILLAGRNLVLAERQGIQDLYVVCPSCFVRLRTAEKTLASDREKNDLLEEAIGKRYLGSVRLHFFLEVATSRYVEIFKKAVVNPLKGLRGVLYFGCLLTRPEWITGFDVMPYEENLKQFVEILGIETIDWGFGKQCCGAHLSMTKSDHVNMMVDRIRDNARRVGANCLIAFCPLCQVTMELRGKNAEPLPVFYISELIGMACKLEGSKKWVRKHLVSPKKLLKENHLI